MGISNELAKQLKDAGFPMPDKEFESWQTWVVKSYFSAYYAGYDGKFEPYLCYFSPGMIITREHIYAPTLSKLIEACTKTHKGFTLFIYEDKCVATVHFHTAEGSTPEEAVASLYLELNKK